MFPTGAVRIRCRVCNHLKAQKKTWSCLIEPRSCSASVFHAKADFITQQSEIAYRPFAYLKCFKSEKIMWNGRKVKPQKFMEVNNPDAISSRRQWKPNLYDNILALISHEGKVNSQHSCFFTPRVHFHTSFCTKLSAAYVQKSVIKAFFDDLKNGLINKYYEDRGYMIIFRLWWAPFEFKTMMNFWKSYLPNGR